MGWKSVGDIKDATVYGMRASPPCCKVTALLKYYKIPFNFVETSPGKPITKGGSYKKIPVLRASGRQVNDSYVICKSILSVVGKFDAEVEEMITFCIQPALEMEAFKEPEDFRKYAVAAGFGVVHYVPGFILGLLSPANMIKKKYPDLKPLVDYGKEFQSKMNGRPFVGGAEPSGHDISLYGTLYFFKKAKCTKADDFLKNSDLQSWYDRVNAKMPPDWDNN